MFRRLCENAQIVSLRVACNLWRVTRDDRLQIWTLMSQRLQSSMLGISSSNHSNYQQHEGQLHASQPHAQALAAAALTSGQRRAPRDEEDVEIECNSTGLLRDIDSCTLPLISANVVGKQRPPQNQQQHIQPLLSPHPLMPSLLEKVRSATSLSSEALSRSSVPKQQQPRKLDPKERFKGKQVYTRSH